MSLEDFEYGRILGKGVFGSVLIVKRKEDNEIYAMKRVKIGGLTKKELENSFNEVRLLASLNHKNVIGYREAFYDQTSKTLNIVMEYADDGDLSTKIKQAIKRQIFFEESKIWSTLIQILEGLKYLHKSDIIHRDLKSANIFLTKKGGVKIGDLNVSKIIGKSMAFTQTGTPYYASPEIWNDYPYDYKCDIWSTGCIIYEMASLKMPFRGTSMQNLYNNVMKGVFEPIPSRYSNDLMDIISLILIKNPNKRPSAEELLNNRIILSKMEKLGMERNFWNNEDEKAMLMRTIKLPRNLNQMNQINFQLPRKNYKKDRYQNEMEMFQNDEYETAKNSFYHPVDKKNKNINKNKNIIHLNNLDNNKGIYIEPKQIKTIIEKKYIQNESNIIDINSKNNYLNNNKNNFNYNYNINRNSINRSKSTINNIRSNSKNKNSNSKKILISNNNKNNENVYTINYNKEKEVSKNNNYIINKKQEIYSPQQIISENKKFIIKNPNTESLRISTSNIFNSDTEKTNKIMTSINEPIKLIQNPNINNSNSNIYLNKEEKNIYVPISCINNGSSFVNNIFESQIQKILNKKINIPSTISSIQQQSRQKQNKYISNPSFDNILKNKKTKTIDSQKNKISNNKINNRCDNKSNNNNKNYKSKKITNREIIRNRSCKGIICNNNQLFDEENIVEEKIFKKKKKVKQNFVRRNISTDLLTRKNSSNNYSENIIRRNNSHIIDNNKNRTKENLSNNARLRKISENTNHKNNSHIIENNKYNIRENFSNNTRVRRIKKQLEDIIPPIEFENIFKNRLPSANNYNYRNKSKNNVNVKININNNYNYISSLNINNNNSKKNNNNHHQKNYNNENQYHKLQKNNKNLKNFNNKNGYYNNKRSMRPKSTSSITNNQKYPNENNYKPSISKISNIHQNQNMKNLTDISDNNNNLKKEENPYRYKDFYNLCYQKFIQYKMQKHNSSQKIINFNHNNEIQQNNNYKNDGRKIVYEKINVIQKKGEERKYIKGPTIIRNVGEGNFNNQCHRAIYRYQNLLKQSNDYSIQNLINKDFKDEKFGPRIILPKKLMMSN